MQIHDLIFFFTRTQDKMFTPEDLMEIDALGSEMLATGKLGRTDGWTIKDVSGPDFDPTTIRLPLVGW